MSGSPPMGPEQEYLAHLAQGFFMLQRSRSSGRYVFYPRVADPVTGACDLEWVPSSGLGTVHATTVIRPKPPQSPYNVVLVELDEGPRMMSRVENLPAEAVCIGMRVRARITSLDDRPFVVFDVVEAA